MNPQQIKRLRIDLGWSQAQLGQYFGYSDVAVSKWEQGLTSPSESVNAILVIIRQQLDRQKQKQEFVNGLAAAAVAGGVFALLAYLFKDQ